MLVTLYIQDKTYCQIVPKLKRSIQGDIQYTNSSVVLSLRYSKLNNMQRRLALCFGLKKEVGLTLEH